jgi:hypothetical protein
MEMLLLLLEVEAGALLEEEGGEEEMRLFQEHGRMLIMRLRLLQSLKAWLRL